MDDTRRIGSEWQGKLDDEAAIAHFIRTLLKAITPRDVAITALAEALAIPYGEAYRLWRDHPVVRAWRYACPCCGHRTLSQPRSFDICPVCFWEADPLQNAEPDYAGGANRLSLRQAQQNYATFGANETLALRYVRPPTPEERRDEDWRPLDSQN
jgi:hypothetical protein